MKEFCGFSETVKKIIECFIKDKFEAYLDTRLANMGNSLEKYKEINSEIANVKDSISKLRDENKRIKREIEDWKKWTGPNKKGKKRILNPKITEELNLKLKEVENAQNIINITQKSLRDKISEILNKPNNPKLERDFRETYFLFENDPIFLKSPLLMQAFQDYFDSYRQRTSIYLINGKDERSNLLIYDTERQREKIETLEIKKWLDSNTCIAQLPGAKLFCFGNGHASGDALIIDNNGKFQELPSGTPCYCSSAIYFNNNVYCFGGGIDGKDLTLSCRFDLDINQWIELTPMPEDDIACKSIIFDGNILISGYKNRQLLQYSINDNSFKTIPFLFAYRKVKILINAEEKLYLIECEGGSIYESENSITWKRIADSIITSRPVQVYCSYNKGAIYIGTNFKDGNKYYKFNLNEKSLSESH